MEFKEKKLIPVYSGKKKINVEFILTDVQSDEVFITLSTSYRGKYVKKQFQEMN